MDSKPIQPPHLPVRRSTRPSLVVLDDDPVTRSMIAKYFSGEDFTVYEAGTAAECRTILRQSAIDIVFVDIHLPDGNGIDLAQEIRAENTVGIVFVTQYDSDIDQVLGLESAGDDYVTKPLNLRVLMARARALLRRRSPDNSPSRPRPVVTFGGYLMDLIRRELATEAGEQIKLTRGEFDLLAALIEANGRPLYRDYLAEVISSRPGESDTRTVDSLVARLRRKFAKNGSDAGVIVTVFGVGYRLGIALDPA